MRAAARRLLSHAGHLSAHMPQSLQDALSQHAGRSRRCQIWPTFAALPSDCVSQRCLPGACTAWPAGQRSFL